MQIKKLILFVAIFLTNLSLFNHVKIMAMHCFKNANYFEEDLLKENNNKIQLLAPILYFQYLEIKDSKSSCSCALSNHDIDKEYISKLNDLLKQLKKTETSIKKICPKVIKFIVENNDIETAKLMEENIMFSID